ncbi:hypothetical protein [Vreelandella venusta]|uniref:Uncharacterized protein n=1 Tax=Vreelandella venusta TaxID=44935 RepID=A0AAP9ZE72_9GAMM|nr:hypothetical protein [Halomonas venusta]MDW0358627.1 hypothetical protein [Halomonas venusta]QPI64842.1 hypothetical protein IR195_03735 [Halomonas venusta]QRL04036.1 hypothetical protein JDS37_03485 [Halomonas venusta]WAM52743.1 hypothetical protein L0520_03355 [Halomonas venusta]
MFSFSGELTQREVAIQLLFQGEYSRAELAGKLRRKPFQLDEIAAE